MSLLRRVEGVVAPIGSDDSITHAYPHGDRQAQQRGSDSLSHCSPETDQQHTDHRSPITEIESLLPWDFNLDEATYPEAV